jgi:HK97 family phage major capsid protein
MTEEEKKAAEEAAAKAKKEALESVKKTATEAAQKSAQELIDAKVAEITAKFEGVTTKEEAEKVSAEFKKSLSELQATLKEMKQTSGNGKTEKAFNDHLADAIAANEAAIKAFASKKGSPEVQMTLKAVGDMSIAANFTGATPFIQQVNPGLIWNPYNRVWLADLLPSATSTANSVIYPKENGGEGAVAHWDGTGDKAQVDYDMTSQTAFFKWLAGFVIVDREMLDDIPWLTSYLQQKLLISLKTAENNFVLNGTSDTNPVVGLLDSATAYDGDYTELVDMIIDGGFGQIVEGTNDFYVPTNAVLNPRDAVKIGLNKSSGSGEYDLPQGSVAFANGKLSIAGLDTVATTSIDKNDFLVFDKNATMFLRRMAPEIRLFEDAALAKVNKVMFRIEERVSMAVFNNDAIITGTYVAPVE